MNVNLEYYKIFYYVGKFQSITLAAEALSLSQPAVSQGIKSLEKALGSPLFLRKSKGVILTSEGEILYSYIQRGYETILLGEQKFREIQNIEDGEIRIGASDMTLQFYLLPYLEIFHNKFPKIKVHVTNGTTPETLAAIEKGKIDFGVVSSPVPVKKGLQVKEVREVEDIFVAGESYFDLKEEILTYKKLEDLPFICLEGNTSTRNYVDEFLKNNQVTLKPEFELAISDMIVQFAIRNFGVASITRDFAEKYLELGQLIQLRFDHPIPKRQICIVSDTKVPLTAAAREFLNLI